MKEQLAIVINHLQHVGIPVTDIARSASFYARFGFKNVMQSSFTMDGETGVCIMMQCNAITLELYQLPVNKLQEIKQRKNGHIDHIAFDVDDVDAVFAILKNASFHIVEEAPVFLAFWEKGCKYFNILGPDGERLEFNQVIRQPAL